MLDLSQFEGHTPGPWQHASRNGWDVVVSSKYPTSTAICGLAENNGANARLIAAAPELLAEVKRLREALKWYASDEAWTMEQTEGSNGDYGTKARAALNPKE